MRKLILPRLVVLAILMLIMIPNAATAQEGRFQYAAKFICGKSDSDETGVAPGQYFTMINVRNPSASREVRFTKKFAIALIKEKAGPLSRSFIALLRPDTAMGIDCVDIYGHTAIAPGKFVEGFVVIVTPTELDVVGVYTAGTPAISTMHIERVPSRRFVP